MSSFNANDAATIRQQEQAHGFRFVAERWLIVQHATNLVTFAETSPPPAAAVTTVAPIAISTHAGQIHSSPFLAPDLLRKNMSTHVPHVWQHPE